MAQPIKKTTLDDNNFSLELSYLLDYISKNIYDEKEFSEITPEVFVMSALEEKGMLYRTVNAYLTNDSLENIHDKLYEEAKEKEKKRSSYIAPAAKYSKPNLSSELKHFFAEAQKELDNNEDLLTSDRILLSILKEEGKITNLFKSEGVTYNSLKKLSKGVHDVMDDVNDTQDEENKTSKKKKTGDFRVEKITDTPFGKMIEVVGSIDPNNFDFGQIFEDAMKKSQPNRNTKKSKEIPYCTDLTELAEKGQFDPLIGRENEVDEIFRVLGRRQLNNVILVGDTGVGKSQIINGLCNLIVKNQCPIQFRGKRVVKFNPSDAMSGTSLRGQFEDHMSEMTEALRNNKNVILVIDDIHNILSDRGKNEYDTGGVLSQLFNDNDIQVIATTQDKGYKTLYDAVPDVAKRFQKVNIDGSTEEDTVKILYGIREGYEKFHNVTYSDEILKECVALSKKYITEKSLPSSAIDVMDEVGSYKKLNDERVVRIKWLYRNKEQIDKDYEQVISGKKKDDNGNIRMIYEDIKKDLAVAEGEYRDADKLIITEEDLHKTISLHTGIPVSKVTASDKKVLSLINSKLKAVIVGQDEAIDAVSRAIKRNKIGLSQQRRPMGSFFLVGTSGVGKSLLAKTLAKEIFGDEKYLVRFDMSEYIDQTSVNKLIGSSAGYVGYNEGGLLTEAVKKQKYAVVLIDEIEKANEQVYNLFLQVLDEGYLNDNMGQKVDFRNTIIIMTSNVGTKLAGQTHALGFDADETVTKKEIIEKELKKKFPPEFINRLDQVVYFNRLTDDNLKDIIRLELAKTAKKLNDLGYTLTYTVDVIDELFKIVIKDKEYGARPVIRTICNEIENPITDMIIENDTNKVFYVNVEDNKIKIQN